MINENRAQISGEYLLLVGSLILIALISIAFIAHQHEITLAMTAAKNGVNEGLSISSSGIYPKDSYNDYSKSDYLILEPYSVEIINISYSDMGYDSNYNKQKIQFKVYAHISKDFSKKELDSVGDRINYNLRKSIAYTFGSVDATNKLYNPVFSQHYIFTTANVNWL